MQVKKRNGNLEPFDRQKIVSAIQKAFLSCNESVKDEVIIKIANEVDVWDGINIEDIQDQIEELLLDYDYSNVYKSFSAYRQYRIKVRNLVKKKQAFIENFKKSDNTANATIDDNSNVNTHNVAVMNTELHKEDNMEINLSMWENKISELFPEISHKQLRIDASSILYLHDLSSQVGMPYCVAISMYPFLINGLKDLGGLSSKPENIDSFCGLFVNLVFAVASQYKGAVATPAMLLYMDYFIRREWGDDYYTNYNDIISNSRCKRQQTILKQIHQYFQQICYSLMQPSGSRGNQAVFWNISIFDRPFYETMYSEFYFPDGSQPIWESFNWLQKEFLHWLNQERLKCILTFPVISACLIYQNGKFLDEELYEYLCEEYAQGNSFFTYISDSADSLSSCCRLSSKIEKPQFNFTNGQLSEMTGSKNVITLNLNRIVQDAISENPQGNIIPKAIIKNHLLEILDRVYKYQIAYNELLMDYYNSGLLTVYTAGFIDMKKQYLTIGINGLNQAAEFLGIECNKNKEYEDFCNFIFTTIKEQNALHKTKDLMFNTEFTPYVHVVYKLLLIDSKLLKEDNEGQAKIVSCAA